MNHSYIGDNTCGRILNAVALQNAVLCADCDVLSDSPHETCMVCGSKSLFNISRMLGGDLPQERATLLNLDACDRTVSETVLSFPRWHRIRRKISA